MIHGHDITTRDVMERTLTTDTQAVIREAPSRFVCWNCCGLRFESVDHQGTCPNCGHEACACSQMAPLRQIT